MNPKLRRHLPGSFVARQQGRAWRLSRSRPSSVDVFVQGVKSGTTEGLPSTLHNIDIEWRGDEVVLTWADQHTLIRAQSVIVHEPLPDLYRDLPLAVLDENARRFWRRVFTLVRIPGGRYLLGAVARRSRAAR